MTKLLAPLVGDAPTVTFIGLCKNAGKTTAMCRLIRELEGEVLEHRVAAPLIGEGQM